MPWEVVLIFTGLNKKKFSIYNRIIIIHSSEMPGAKDITKDLGKLRKRNILPAGEPPVLPSGNLGERRQAFNAWGFFFWTFIVIFLCLQALFLFWLAR
jgi:hypothetical protein